MKTENLSTLKINKLTQEQYDRALEEGKINENEIYLTPDDVPLTSGTGKNSIIANNIEEDSEDKNTAISSNSSAFGSGSLAGGRGFRYSTMNVDKNENTTTFTIEGNYTKIFAKKPVCTIITNSFYDLYDAPKSVTYDGTNTILEFTGTDFDTTEPNISANPYKKVIHIPSQPDLGDTDIGLTAFASGENTQAIGCASHAEGRETKAVGAYAHAEGRATEAVYSAHAEGWLSKAYGRTSHAEGYRTEATKDKAHSEGQYSQASGEASHAEGSTTKSIGPCSHAEGSITIAEGPSSHSEGIRTEATAKGSHAEGIAHEYTNEEGKTAYRHTMASGTGAHAEGVGTTASSKGSHAEGAVLQYTDSNGNIAYQYTMASNEGAHAEGVGTLANAKGAHAEGIGVYTYENSKKETIYKYAKAEGEGSHAEGTGSQALFKSSHAEGAGTEAHSEGAHAEGVNTKASGAGAHAEGQQTLTSKTAAHAEGRYSQATGDVSHAEGNNTTASGIYSHAEGNITKAQGLASHAGGIGTIADSEGQTAIGKYNTTNSGALFSVGNGDKTARSDAFNVYEDRTEVKAMNAPLGCVRNIWTGTTSTPNDGLIASCNFYSFGYFGSKWKKDTPVPLYDTDSDFFKVYSCPIPSTVKEVKISHTKFYHTAPGTPSTKNEMFSAFIALVDKHGNYACDCNLPTISGNPDVTLQTLHQYAGTITISWKTSNIEVSQILINTSGNAVPTVEYNGDFGQIGDIYIQISDT